MDPIVQFVGDIKPLQDTQLFRVRLRPMPSTLSLAGTLGLRSNRLADLPLCSSRFWVHWSDPELAELRRRTHARHYPRQNACEEQRLPQYEQVVLTALEDVEIALVAYSREQTRCGRLAEAVEANQRAVELANELDTRVWVIF